MQKLWKYNFFQKIHELINHFLLYRFPVWLRWSFQKKVRAWNWDPVRPDPIRSFHYSAFKANHPNLNEKEAVDAFCEFLKKESRVGRIAAVSLDQNVSETFELNFENNFYGKSINENIHRLQIHGNRVNFKNAIIHSCSIANNAKIEITTSIFGLLEITNCIELQIKNSFVLEINFGISELKDLKFFNSKFDSFIFNYEPENKILTKTVEIKNINFGTKSGLFQYFGTQNLRNFRRNLENLEHTLAANTIRVFELRAERSSEPLFTRGVNKLYDLCSLYGTSTTRPFFILIGTWVLTATWLDCLNEAMLTNEISYYQGWMRTLVDSEWWRSFYLTTQSSYNYISIFGQEQSIIAKSHWVRGVLFVEGLFSLSLILMIIFGLRKRFKLS